MEKTLILQQQSKAFTYHLGQNNIPEAKQAALVLLQLKPRNRPLLENLAAFFIDIGSSHEAQMTLDFLQQAFRFCAYWYVLLARLSELQDKYEATIAYAQEGLKSDLLPWQKAILYNILGRVYTDLGDISQAAKYYLCSTNLPDNRGKLWDYSNYLFVLHYREYDSYKMFRDIVRYNDFLRGIKQYNHFQPYIHEKIRIGYISPDFRYHIVAFFAYALLKYYDRSRFTVYAYANCLEDGASRDLSANVDGWRNIYNLSSEEAAAVIHRDEIDILVDLSGHTANNCLPIMAYKPAPVQISGIGWFDSTGLDCIDYFLTDRLVDPSGKNDEFFSEKLIRMSHSHLCYMWHSSPPFVDMPAFIRKGFITFGCLNNLAKISDEILALWCAILKKVTNARLLLKAKALGKELPRKKFIERLQKIGFDLSKIVLEGYSQDYLNTYAEIDIALDTFPYPGGGTTCDALYMGVPVVTMVGDTHSSRFGCSILQNLQLRDLCAYSCRDYIEIACKLAQDREKLIYLHQNLRRKMIQSSVMDSASYMMEVESIYERIIHESQTVVTLEELYRLEDGQAWNGIIHQANKMLLMDLPKDIEAQVWALLGEAYLSSIEYKSVERAVYALKRAISFKDVSQRLRWLCYLSEAAQLADDFALRYQAAHEAAQLAMTTDRENIPKYWLWNVHSYCAHAALDLGFYQEAENEYWLAIGSCEDIDRKLSIISSYLLACHYKDYSTRAIWQGQQLYAQAASQINPLPAIEPGRSKGRIRIGYLSPDFRKHAMFPILYGMLACYDRSRFSVVCYQLNDKSDEYTKHLRSLVDEWYEVTDMSHAEIAHKIQGDAIDILVDLGSHSRGTGLPVLLYRPAKVQVSGLGSLCSTGAQAVDYYITDPIVDPPGIHDDYFAEKILYLPAQFSYTGPENVPNSAGTPVLSTEYIQLGCFQEYRKITDEMLEAWKVILESLPTARLLIKSIPFASASLTDMAYERMDKLGLPMERVSLEMGDDAYMERLLDVDIMLDTYPYTGGRTTFDALYMGVPVVTRYGERRNTRFSYSILSSIGMESLAVPTVEQYIQIVIALAGDWEILDMLHKKLRFMLLNSRTAAPVNYMKFLEKKYMEIVDVG